MSRRLPLALAITLVLSACQPAAPVDVAKPVTQLETERQRVSYMVGLDVARNLQPIHDEVDLAIVEQAVHDALAGRAPLLDAAAVEATRQRFTTHLGEKRAAEFQAQAARNQQQGDAFLARNAQQPGVHATASGLQYQVLRDASGPRPAADATVRVNYIGKLLDGHEFENSYALDHPAEFPLAQMMPGWREGLTLMPMGSKYRFWIPARLAYGERGVPGVIGPNATLTFDVELLAVAATGEE